MERTQEEKAIISTIYGVTEAQINGTEPLPEVRALTHREISSSQIAAYKNFIETWPDDSRIPSWEEAIRWYESFGND